jgi:hypothetical protein
MLIGDGAGSKPQSIYLVRFLPAMLIDDGSGSKSAPISIHLSCEVCASNVD